MVKKNSFTYKLSSPQQSILINILKTGNYKPTRVEHTIIAIRNPDCSVNLYKSGKCLVQGKGAADFITFVLEPLVLMSVSLGYEDVLDPSASTPHMGIDESGKGDLFGPIVIAAAYVDEKLAEQMREMDVKDSKNITSDKKAMALGGDLRRLLGRRFSIVKIGPEAYNRLYSKMRNVNTLLGWAHARAIENLLDTVPDCPRAISDQFGKKEQVEKALMQKGKKIELIQRHKAESDIAVAAASIIARDAFLRSLIAMQKEYNIEFPKGASERVKETAIELAKNKGAQILLKTVKCHFKTTDAVLQAIGSDRSALGPEGQAVSKAFKGKYARKKT